MQESIATLEQERDFYYGKLRSIEVYCEPFDKEAIAEADEETRNNYELKRAEYQTINDLADRIRETLFEEANGFTRPEESEELGNALEGVEEGYGDENAVANGQQEGVEVGQDGQYEEW